MRRDLIVSATPLAAAAGLPRVLVRRTRMAMHGPAYSYGLFVREADAPEPVRANCTYFTIPPGRSIRDRLIDFATATCPAEHFSMPRGWARYDAWVAHERLAAREALALAREAFPELRAYAGEALPKLGVEMPWLIKYVEAVLRAPLDETGSPLWYELAEPMSDDDESAPVVVAESAADLHRLLA